MNTVKMWDMQAKDNAINVSVNNDELAMSSLRLNVSIAGNNPFECQ